MPHVDWAEIAANRYTLPPGMHVEEVLPELLSMLGSPDAVVRDEQVYLMLAVWTCAGHLDAVLDELDDACAANLGRENVLLRSFSALVLAECVRQQKHTELLEAAIPERWYAAWQHWYAREADVRAFEDGTGWIHALAHGADFAREWALSWSDSGTLRQLGQVLTARLSTVPVYLHQSEHDRLALALLAIFSRPAFNAACLREWSAQFRTLWTTSEQGVVPPGAALALNTLQSLHTLLHLGAKIDGQLLRPAHPQAALSAVQDALRSVYDYYGEGEPTH